MNNSDQSLRDLLSSIECFQKLNGPNGTMSANNFNRKMKHAIQLKWTFLALKWAVLGKEKSGVDSFRKA